ncbi:MAG: outer membrane beta-barrel protein [Betaproteobacteria bacterium]
MRKSLLIPTIGFGASLMLAGSPLLAQNTDTQPTSTTTSTTNSYDNTTGGLRMPYHAGFWNYVGISAGKADYRGDCPSGTGCEDEDTGGKIYTGGKFNDWLGLELGYVYLGRPETLGGRQDAQGLNFSVVGSVPIGTVVGLNAKVGTVYGWTNTQGNVPVAYAGRDQGFGLSYGFGATVSVTKQVQLRVDWDRYHMPFRGRDDNVDMISAGVQYLF